jgi:hypothetical protein
VRRAYTGWNGMVTSNMCSAELERGLWSCTTWLHVVAGDRWPFAKRGHGLRRSRACIRAKAGGDGMHACNAIQFEAATNLNWYGHQGYIYKERKGPHESSRP